MGVRCCSDDKKSSPLEAAVKQAREHEEVFFSTQLSKCAVTSPYQLYIPKEFVEYCASRQWELKQNQKLLLEGYEIGFWWKVIVLVSRSPGGSKILSARIGKGWRDFAIANGVEIGDTVLFTLVRTNRFVVKFFHADGRRKKKKLMCLPEPPTAVAKLSNQKSAATQQQQFMMKDLRFMSAAAMKRGHMRTMMPRRRMLMPGHKFVEILDSSNDEEEEEDEEELGVPLVRRTVDARDHQHTVVDKIHPERLLGDRKLIHAHGVKYMLKRPRDVTDEERFKAIVAARACAKGLPNISLMLVMRSSEVYHDFHLEMPAQFIRETKLKLPLSSSSRRSWVALLDCDNKSWEVLIRRVIEQNQQQQNCLMLSPKGWARFALDHDLEEGDACVFELVSNSPELPMFRVHIFRVLPMTGENAPAVADSANNSHLPDQILDRKILNTSTCANQSHQHELGLNTQHIRHSDKSAAGINLPSIINKSCSLNVCNPKPEPVLMEGCCSKFNDGSITTTTTSGQWRTTAVDHTQCTMQHNQLPIAAPAPSRSCCCDQQDPDRLATYPNWTQACGGDDDDDDQLPDMQSKLFAANSDHERGINYEGAAGNQRRETLASILQKPCTWRNPHYDTLLETFG